MKLYTGDRLISTTEAASCVSHRASVAGRKGWLAYPVRREKVQRGHNSIVLDEGNSGAFFGEGGRFILARLACDIFLSAPASRPPPVHGIRWAGRRSRFLR